MTPESHPQIARIITAVLVKAVKEQQEQIRQQQNRITGLKKLVCRNNRRASVCKR